MDNPDTLSILKEYEGQNVWLGCTCHGNPYYIRVLELYPSQSIATVNAIPAHVVEDDLGRYGGGRGFTERSSNLNWDDIKFEEPLFVLSSEDIYSGANFENTEVDPEASDLLDQLVGADLWVKVTDLKGWVEDYMLIEKKVGDVITAYFVSAGYIDDLLWQPEDSQSEWTPYGDYYQPPSEDIERKTLHIDSIKLIKPLDMIPDDEMEELLKEADANFYEWANNYYYGDDEY